jgi:SAM-dependent methyltransferase
MPFSLLFKNFYGTPASDPNLDNIQPSFSTPEPEKDGKVKTLNGMGFMTLEHDPYSLAFIAKAQKTELPVLEIGVAYGFTALEAIRNRNAVFIANDLELNHLLILKTNLPEEKKQFVYLNNKRFPQETSFPDENLGAILLCKMMHFLTADEMEIALDKLYSWLSPGGYLYIVTTSPYHHYLSAFSPIYEQRWEQGDPWPGIIQNMRDYAPDLGIKIPHFLHVMDPRPLEQALSKRGFNIQQATLFDFKRPNSKSSNGRGYCGIIAIK